MWLISRILTYICNRYRAQHGDLLVPYVAPIFHFTWLSTDSIADKGLGKLIEIGNSGMFRPEMLESMGLPYVVFSPYSSVSDRLALEAIANLWLNRRDMKVYGCGISLERPTMIRFGISNIRELLGHKVNLNFVQTSPAVRLDKE